MFHDGFRIIAGPCAVESRKQINEIASFLSSVGIKYLRGGAFKPRSSPYSFQGLGIEGLEMLYEMKAKYSLRVVTEILDYNDFGHFKGVDILQIGARNMYNYSLLSKIAGYTSKEIMLKRGLAATITDWLSSAEYLKVGGNSNFFLCERGIMRYGQEMRNLLDISSVPYIKQTAGYNVIVDPSHGTGRRSLIIPLSKASKAIGADGIMIEVHSNPKEAKSDSAQQLNFSEFETLLKELDI